MPLYLVRWPDLSASLVSAKNEEHLLDILDQEANPEGCEWSRYDGPLAINFRLPAECSIKDERPGEPVAPSQVVVEDIGPLARQHIVDSLEVTLAGGDEGQDFGEAVLQKAFPLLHDAVEKFRSRDEAEAILPEADLRKALHAELTRMLTATWRHAQVKRGTDLISRLAQEMDLPMDLARKYAEIASRQNHGGNDDSPKPGKGSGSRSRRRKR